MPGVRSTAVGEQNVRFGWNGPVAVIVSCSLIILEELNDVRIYSLNNHEVPHIQPGTGDAATKRAGRASAHPSIIL